MPKLRVHNFAISLDGYGAGPDQSTDNPLGVGGERLHEWAFATRTFRQVHGGEGGDEGVDDQFAARGEVGIGATIMGRNMFGPIRGPWGDDQWTGWWGDDPPFHHPVFVLTHNPRPSITAHPARRRRALLRAPRWRPGALRVRGVRQLGLRRPRSPRQGGGLEAERTGPHVGTEQHGICSVSPSHTARPPAALTPVSQDDVPIR
jgi:dihydrofolate reductase